MTTTAAVPVTSIKPEVQQRLDAIASSIRVKLREAGARVIAIGFELAEAKKLLGPGKAFELWLASACGLSLATAYRWIQAAEGFKALRLDQRPDVLDHSDVAEILSVTFPQAFRLRIQKRIDALDKAEADAAEVKKQADAEARKLEKAERELADAEGELRKATEKANAIRAKADETLKPAQEKADGLRSKVRDIRQRLTEAKGKVVEIEQAAKVRVMQAQQQAQQARQAVVQAQQAVTQAVAKVETAKADVKAEAKQAVTSAKARGKPEADAKGEAWDVFLRQWLNTLEAKVKETFPVEQQAAVFQGVGNAVLALSQAYRKKAA
jgi:hypothetical protein